VTTTRAAGVTGPAAVPQPGAGLPPVRRRVGLLLAAAGLPALTATLVPARSALSLGSVLLLYLLAVVVISVVGGLIAAILAAVSSFLLANFFLTPPFHTLVVEDDDSVIALLVFLAVAVTVSVLVDVAARRQADAARSEAEAALLGRVAAEPVAGRSAEDVLAEVTHTFGLTSVTLVERIHGSDSVLAHVGAVSTGTPSVTVPAGANRVMLGHGPQLFAEDRRLLTQLARAAASAVDARRLVGEAERARELADVDRLRSALLAAVGHDLRTPLAAIKAAASTLSQPDVHLAPADRDDLLATIVRSTDRLADLISNLLDLSRLEAGALSIDLQPVPLDEVVARALLDRHLPEVDLGVGDDLPMVRSDPGLLERVLANLLDNAHKHSPPNATVEVTAKAEPTVVVMQVIDHGPGVPEKDWTRMFLPFQRLDDHRNETGVGLGLAIARGFTEALGGSIDPGHTPGGGLTMTLTLPRAGAAP
jgi:K+-sensing histidine kinase KdpD